MQVTRADGVRAQCVGDGRAETVDLSLVGPQPVGGWVLAHLGVAREVISAEDAALIARAHAGLRAVLKGGDLGDAFADLEGRTPQMPPDPYDFRRDDNPDERGGA